ncbi:MAG TPA: hypothetical protein PLZ86_09460, partial [bacterium]|nr:hypothetical protein [bacterium]
AMDSEGSIYLSGLLKPTAADFYTGIIRKYALVGADFEMVESIEKTGGDNTKVNRFGGMTVYTKDGVDSIIVSGIFSSAISTSGGIYRYDTDLQRLSQYESTWDPRDILLDMAVIESEDLIYAAGKRIVNISDTEALVSSYRLSTIMGSGAIANPLVTSVTRNPMSVVVNSFNSVSAGYEDHVIVAGLYQDNGGDGTMVVEKFDKDLTLVRSRTDYTVGRVNTEGYGVAVDSWGNILAVGLYEEGPEYRPYRPTAWKFDRNLNGSYTAP